MLSFAAFALLVGFFDVSSAQQQNNDASFQFPIGRETFNAIDTLDISYQTDYPSVILQLSCLTDAAANFWSSYNAPNNPRKLACLSRTLSFY